VIRALEEYLRSEVSLKRYLHSLRVANTVVRLCEHFDLPTGEGVTAGMAHDIAREWDSQKLLEYARRDGYGISTEERRVPLLLHGRAAAAELQSRYGESREDVLQAVRWHTTGHPDMGRLGMALFCADYMEPGRSHIDECEYERLMRCASLEEMTLTILDTELDRMHTLGRNTVDHSYALRTMLVQRVEYGDAALSGAGAGSRTK